ncbi:MAG: PadR family transcriptional regulator [Ktedonobacterales bacterium]
MYELIILTLLARWPLHGYLIAKITNDMLGPYARLSNGRLYPLLAKLEAAGLIEVADESSRSVNGRRQRVYALTEAGRKRFHALMMDTTSNQGDYQRIFWYKVPDLYLLSLSEQLYLLDHYITYCQAHIFHYTAEIADIPKATQVFEAPPPHDGATVFAMEHVLRLWRDELDSAQRWRARIVAAAEQAGAQEDAASAAAGSEAGSAGHGQRGHGSRRATRQSH